MFFSFNETRKPITMNKKLIPVLALATCVFSAQAQYFTNGNLAVLRIGGPGESVTTTDSGNTVWVDQYSTNGTLVNSLSLPTNGTDAFILDGVAYVGLMTLTPDGRHLVVGGYNTSAPYISNSVPANFAFASSTNVPRAIATIDGYGNFALPIVNSNMFNTFAISGAVSDGSNYWADGTGGTAAQYGLIYCGMATAPATNEVVTGLYGSGGRAINIYNGNLYVNAFPSNSSYPNSGVFELNNVGGALPTTAAGYSQPIITGTTAASTPVDLVINPQGTIAYVADYGLGIEKFTYNGSSWVSNYTVVPTNAGYATVSGSFHAISVTADFTQTPPIVYATTGELITNRLVMFQDNGPGSTIINLASNLNVAGVGGMTNTFRGVRFAPGSAPVITTAPVAANATVGGASSATFTTAATGTGPLTYQWYVNGVAVSGATNTTLTLSDLTTAMNGEPVDVVVSWPYGTATSTAVPLNISPYSFATGNLAGRRIGGP